MKRCTHCQVCNCELNSENKVKGYGRCHPCHLVKKKEEYQRNRPTYLANKKVYNVTHREILAEKSKVYYQENKEELKVYKKEYNEKHKDHIKARTKNYYENNKETISAYNKAYVQANKAELYEKHRIYLNNRYKTDPEFNLIVRLRARVRSVLKSKNLEKCKSTLDYLGCSSAYLIVHLESQFVEGMTWENRNLWHIDHIIPISSANTQEDIARLSHYTNLQPLWAPDNIKKSDKIIEPQKEEEDVTS